MIRDFEFDVWTIFLRKLNHMNSDLLNLRDGWQERFAPRTRSNRG
jgi:hypothetical protein